jgi:hypothetical protein
MKNSKQLDEKVKNIYEKVSKDRDSDKMEIFEVKKLKKNQVKILMEIITNRLDKEEDIIAWIDINLRDYCTEITKKNQDLNSQDFWNTIKKLKL